MRNLIASFGLHADSHLVILFLYLVTPFFFSPSPTLFVSVLSQIDCPYVTKYYGSYLRKHELWIIMEYLGGGSCLDLVCMCIHLASDEESAHSNRSLPTLCIHIQLKPGPFAETYIAVIVREVLKGLEYLHGERKLHRDIKGMFGLSIWRI